MRIPLVPSAYVFLRRESEVLLQLRQNTGFMDGHWAAGAAGHVEAGESVFTAAAREVAEELDVRVDVADLVSLTSVHRTDGTDTPIEQRVDWFFALTAWEGEPRIVEHAKCADLRWWPLASLPEPMPAYERDVLDRLRTDDLPAVITHGFPS